MPGTEVGGWGVRLSVCMCEHAWMCSVHVPLMFYNIVFITLLYDLKKPRLTEVIHLEKSGWKHF